MSEGYCCGIVLCGVNVGIPWNLIDIKSKNIILRALCCLLNIFLTPLLLIGNTFRLYIFPCVSILVGKSWNNFVRVTCGSWSLYVDHEFPPTNESLGKSTSGIEWIRIQDLQKEQKSRLSLFGKMDPKSICQGALGDCWLLAAFATLCERPELIRSCFITSTFNPQGKYKIRLFDKRGKPVRMTIDDLIPCKNGTPVYAKLATSEIWPLLLEKAFAKINGSYHGIEGGDPMVAMKMVSGYEGESFHSPFDATVFPTLQKYFDAGCLISAGSKGKDNTLTQGRDALKETIVPGHAYSILNIKTPTLTTASVKLLKLRNPWGSFEWKGDWGDDSSLWVTYPGVRFEIGRPDKVDDGMFFMSWEDFITRFDFVQVVFPSVSVDNLRLSLNEDIKICGTSRGCVAGCAKFWCLCKGCYDLWWPETSMQTKARLTGADKGKVVPYQLV